MTDTDTDLPTNLGLATAGTRTVHAAWLDGRPTLCDRAPVRWLPGRDRAAVTCRACTNRYGRMRWTAGDWAPVVSLAELEAAGFYTHRQEI